MADVHFDDSNTVGRPTLHICPEFSQAYDEGVMQTFGIEKGKYKRGDWPRTVGVDERDIFDQVTHNISQIIKGIEFGFVGALADKKYYGEDLQKLRWTSIAYDHFGRCFGIRMDNQFDDLKAATIVTKIDSIIWVHQYGQMLSPDGKTKFEIMTKNKCLFITLTYKLFKTSTNCNYYHGEEGYDFCTVTNTAKQLWEGLGCVLPMSNSSYPICQNNSHSIQAFQMHDAMIGKFSSICPNPCKTMQVSFGFPSYGECGKQDGEGWARLYFKQNIEVIEDRLNYSLLRFSFIDVLSYILSIFSMVAEIGGMSGLLLGISVLEFIRQLTTTTIFFCKWLGIQEISTARKSKNVLVKHLEINSPNASMRLY